MWVLGSWQCHTSGWGAQKENQLLGKVFLARDPGFSKLAMAFPLWSSYLRAIVEKLDPELTVPLLTISSEES